MLLLLGCAQAGPPPSLTFTEFARVDSPTAIAVPPRGDLHVTEQVGRIWRLGAQKTLALDLREKVRDGGECGLLGLAFAPKWPEDPRIFVNYTYEAPHLRTRIASYTARPDGTFDPASEVEILSFEQPYSNHNSGSLVFGPDGMLYVGVGDGGAGGDPQGHAQDRGDWLGSILRIDVSVAPYRVPPDNPFVGQPGVLPEIWAYGVRNPWGMHFDGETLWFADVGQNAWEEVNRGVAGANYGWNQLEGTHCYTKGCSPTGTVLPVAEYGHDVGQSVTGGTVYRGPSIPALDGKYVYADFATGRYWTVDAAGKVTLLGDTDQAPSTFGTGPDGTLYVADYRGMILRVGR